MSKDKYVRVDSPFGPEDLDISVDSSCRIYLKNSHIGYFNQLDDGDRVLTIDIPTNKTLGGTLSKIAGSLESLKEGDIANIVKAINFEQVTCLTIKKISGSKILSLIDNLAKNCYPGVSSLKKIDLSEISVRNLSADGIKDMSDVVRGITRIKTVNALALCRIDYDKKGKEKIEEATSLDGCYFDNNFLPVGSILNIKYVPGQKGIREVSHLKLFKNRLFLLGSLIEKFNPEINRDEQMAKMMQVTNLIFENNDIQFTDELSIDDLKKIHKSLSRNELISSRSKFVAISYNLFSEKDQPVSFLISKILNKVTWEFSLEYFKGKNLDSASRLANNPVLPSNTTVPVSKAQVSTRNAEFSPSSLFYD